MEEPTRQPTQRPRALILRIYLDEAGTLRGRIDDPASEARTPFAGGAELLALIHILARETVPLEGNDL